MVKARLKTKDGKPVYFFGLSEGNLMRLREGKPILVNLMEFGGPDIRVAIAWGETEEAILEDMKKNDLNPPEVS